MVQTHTNPGVAAWRQLYRSLLRSSAAAVRFNRPAARNTRRYLRDEFASLSKHNEAKRVGDKASITTIDNKRLGELKTQTTNTLAFHLSSSLYGSTGGAAQENPPPSPSLPTATNPVDVKVGQSRLAHRLVSNLSSLTYHHLSPHTQMQMHTHRIVARKQKRLTSLARVLSARSNGASEYGEEEGFGGEVMLNRQHMKLNFLQPSGKPVRGPVSAKFNVWDGQDPEKLASVGGLRQMEADLATVEALLQSQEAKFARYGDSKQVRELKEEAALLQKKIKTTAKGLVAAQEKSRVEEIAIQHLADLVAAAQDAEGLLLGKERWLKRRRDEFLPP